MATALAASLAALGMTEYKDRVKELAKKRKNSFFLLLMTKLHSVSVLMVLVEMGRVNFFVKDLIPLPSSRSCKMPGLPARLNPDNGLWIFLMAVCPVGSLVKVSLEDFFFLPEIGLVVCIVDFLLFEGVSPSVACGAPESPGVGAAKNLSTSPILILERFFQCLC